MKLIPTLQTVSPSAARPGELIQHRSQDNPKHALIAVKGTDRHLVPLCLPLKYFLVASNDDYILSYGTDYVFHIPESARFITSFDGGFDANGVMIIDGHRAVIRLAGGKPVEERLYEIATGQFFEQPATDHRRRWAVLDWEIRLNSQPVESPPLFAFKAP